MSKIEITPDEIKEARKALGLTQAQMTPLLGYSHVMRVSDLERGKASPSDAVILLLRAYLAGYRPSDWPEAQVRKNAAK